MITAELASSLYLVPSQPWQWEWWCPGCYFTWSPRPDWCSTYLPDLITAGLACYVVTLVASMSHTLVDRNLMSFDTALVPCLKATLITMENFYWGIWGGNLINELFLDPPEVIHAVESGVFISKHEKNWRHLLEMSQQNSSEWLSELCLLRYGLVLDSLPHIWQG